MSEDLAKQDESVAKLSKEKKNLEDSLQEQINATQAEEDKVSHLTKTKKKLEETIHDVSELDLSGFFAASLGLFCGFPCPVQLHLSIIRFRSDEEVSSEKTLAQDAIV